MADYSEGDVQSLAQKLGEFKETLTPGESKAAADFVTVYNFYGLVEGSAKSPAGWEFYF